VKNEHPEIPWKKVAAMRDILTHEYFGLNLTRIWLVAQNDLPALKESIIELYKQICKGE
jgi:uncharacterized protein with HEPN domain